MLLFVLVGALLNMIVGTIWYMPSVFGDIWLKEIGLKKNKMTTDMMISAMITSFICYMIVGYVLLQMPRAFSGSIGDMVTSVIMLWVGFIAAIRLSHFAFEQKSFRLFWISSLHDLVGLLVMGVFFYYVY